MDQIIIKTSPQAPQNNGEAKSNDSHDSGGQNTSSSVSVNNNFPTGATSDYQSTMLQQSDGSEKGGGDTGSTGGVDRKDICRDFLNNICNRGAGCKFYHPPDAQKRCAAEEPYNFCLDHQNKSCDRDNCRYVHASREDVNLYKTTGEVSLGLARALAALSRTDVIAGIPVCKQYQNGRCDRGQQCRYWHINLEDERFRRFAGRSCGGGSVLGRREDQPYEGGAHRSAMGGVNAWRRPPAGGYFKDDEYFGAPPSKRPAYRGGAPAAGSFADMMRTPMPVAPPSAIQHSNASQQQAQIEQLERRNADLLNEVEGLRRENRRERERYEDLLSLFRQTCQGVKPAVASSALSTNISAGAMPVAGMPSQLSTVGVGGISGLMSTGATSHQSLGQQLVEDRSKQQQYQLTAPQQQTYAWSGADQNQAKYKYEF